MYKLSLLSDTPQKSWTELPVISDHRRKPKPGGELLDHRMSNRLCAQEMVRRRDTQEGPKSRDLASPTSISHLEYQPRCPPLHGTNRIATSTDHRILRKKQKFELHFIRRTLQVLHLVKQLRFWTFVKQVYSTPFSFSKALYLIP
jgi:hypothetical protein